MKLGTTLITTTILACLVAQSYQLECYKCLEGPSPKVKGISGKTESATTPCNAFSNSLKSQCPSSFSKVCVVKTIEKDGIISKYHDCGSSKEECRSGNNTEFDGALYTCRFCEVDGCNSGSILTAAIALIGLLLLTVVIH